VSVLDYRAPLAIDAMPSGWRDVDGVMLVAMAERLGTSLATLLEAVTRRPLSASDERAAGWYAGSAAALEAEGRTMALLGWFSLWTNQIEAGARVTALERNPTDAARTIGSDAALERVYLRTIALGELPSDEAPTFSSVVSELRPEFRLLTGRDARVSGPATFASDGGALPWILGALGTWYVLGKRL